MPGVIRTRVGYAGGTKQNPTYHDLGDHSESIEIDFDPSLISFRNLVDVFWKSHEPTRSSWSRQYRAAIFYHNEDQKKVAEETRDQLSREAGRKIATAIEPYSGFTLAEDYHQKHSLRAFPEVLRELRSAYPDLGSFLTSPVVTRVNGYLGGYGSCESLTKELEHFGLSPRVREVLMSAVCGRRAVSACPLP